MYGMPNKIETSQIMEIMSRIPGWIRFNNPRHFLNYKRQKGWERVKGSFGNQPDNLISKTEFVQLRLENIPFEDPPDKASDTNIEN